MANFIRTRALIAQEDLNLGSGSFSRPTSTGGTQSLTKINFAVLSMGLKVVGFSATPTFDVSQGGIQQIILSGNVSSSLLVNANAGQFVLFDVVQDATGGRSFAWPPNVRGDLIQGYPSTHNVQLFYYDGAIARPITPIVMST